MSRVVRYQESDDDARKRRASLRAMQLLADDSDEEEQHDTFMHLYASLMTLLITFFIIIYSTTFLSRAKFELARESLIKIFETAGIDYAFSNSLKVDQQGIITGELEDPVINSHTKDDILKFIMNVENIGPDQVIAVGDGSTRSHFIKNVGLSIAFNPDE